MPHKIITDQNAIAIDALEKISKCDVGFYMIIAREALRAIRELENNDEN